MTKTQIHPIPTQRSTSARSWFVLGLTAAALVGCAEEDDTSVEDEPRAVDVLAEEVVLELARGNSDIVTDRFADEFIDHTDPAIAGAADLVARVDAQRSQYPDASAEVYRVIAEGDRVFVHSHLVLEPGTLGLAVADVFRFEGDQIVERWGGRQEVPETTASGNDMFSTLSAPPRLDPDPAVDTADTRAVMMALGTALAFEKDLDAWDRYTQEPYYQHSINTPNGVEAVKEVWGPIIADPSVVITPVLDVAEGDLYVTINLIDAPQMRLETIDISRVRDGKVLEHWDVVEPRP